VRARVIVVAGPSGSGKSRLCRRLHESRGWPVVNLDDFYKDGDDPTLPHVDLAGGAPIVDWDDPASWDEGSAVAALEELCRTGSAEVPIYDISKDGRVGSRAVSTGNASYVVVEGIFADRVVATCRERGILADAVCIANPRLVTFWRRLVRDLRESRKPPWVLLRRGISLLRAEPQVVARAEAAGCVPLTGNQAFDRLCTLPAGG